MNPKHHDIGLAVEGLSYAVKYDRATQRDHQICLRLLLQFKADPNHESPHRTQKKRPTPIYQAIRSMDNTKIFLGFVKEKAVLNQINNIGKTPLVMVAEAANTEQNEQVAKLLLEAGADPASCQFNPLIVAIRSKNYRVMRLLYEYGIEISD